MEDDKAMEIAETLADNSDVVVIGEIGSGQSQSNYAYALQKALAMGTLAHSMMSGMFPSMDKLFREKPKSECLLPGCENKTSHNKGYCSAECFKKSKLTK